MVKGAAEMAPEERSFCEFIQQIKPARELTTVQRYVLAGALVAGAEAIEGVWSLLFGPPITFVPLLIAVLIASRFLGAGPAWLTAALAAVGLAYDLPMDQRYFGTVVAYLAVVSIMQGSFGGSKFRHRGKGHRVSKNLLLARDWFATRLSLSQHSIEQRRATHQRARAISSLNATG
jgi:hypothetical protein